MLFTINSNKTNTIAPRLRVESVASCLAEMCAADTRCRVSSYMLFPGLKVTLEWVDPNAGTHPGAKGKTSHTRNRHLRKHRGLAKCPHMFRHPAAESASLTTHHDKQIDICVYIL